MVSQSWFDDFLGIGLASRYLSSESGSGHVGMAANPSIDGWLELRTGHSAVGFAGVSLSAASANLGRTHWYSVAEQRIAISWADGARFQFGFVSEEGDGAALVFRPATNDWVLHTVSDGEAAARPTDWMHRPGEAFTARVEVGGGQARVLIDGVERAQLPMGSFTEAPPTWAVSLASEQDAQGFGAPAVWLDYLAVDHASNAPPTSTGDRTAVRWFDGHGGSSVNPAYSTSVSGSGHVGLYRPSETNTWLEIGASARAHGAARVRLSDDAYVSRFEAMNWSAEQNAVGQQRVVLNTTEGLDVTIGWVGRDDPLNVGGALLYRSATKQWFLQTISNNEYTNVVTDWLHTPGVAFTVQIETSPDEVLARINGAEVARITTTMPTDIAYAWENQLWSYPGAVVANPKLWSDYLLVEQERGTDIAFNKPISRDNWIIDTRKNHVQGTESRIFDLKADFELLEVGRFALPAPERILFRLEQANENSTFGFLNPATGSVHTLLRNIDPVWQVVAAGDITGDGTDDVLLRSQHSGSIIGWRVQDKNFGGQTSVFKNLDSIWQVEGTGDFNGDGTADLLIRGKGFGTFLSWTMRDGLFVRQDTLAADYDVRWSLAGIGDFNADGRDDLLLRQHATGALKVMLVQDGMAKSERLIDTALGSDWTVADIGDVNGDSTDDIFLHRPSDNSYAVLTMKMGKAGVLNLVAEQAGSEWSMFGAARVTGFDGADMVMVNRTAGVFSYLATSGRAAGLDASDIFVM